MSVRAWRRFLGLQIGRWLRSLFAMTGKELTQLIRDRVLLIFILYIFTGAIILSAGEGSTELRDAVVAVHDADQSAASRDLLYRLRPPYFRLGREVSSVPEGMRLLEHGDATLLLDIPAGFGRDLDRGGERGAADVQILVDASKANRGFLASTYCGRIAAELSADVAAAGLRRSGGGGTVTGPSVEYRPRLWYNPTMNDVWFSTLAELLTMSTVAGILLPASALVREKERGTIEQLLVSPLTPLQVMLAKVIAMILVTVVGTAVSLFLVMQPLYGVPLRGSVPLYLLLVALYAFANAGLGLAIATFARNSAQTGMLVLMIVMPIIMLSGTRTPMESMPAWLRLVTELFPMRHFVDITYGMLLRGAGFSFIRGSVFALAALGGLSFAIGLRRFRRQFQ